MLNFKILSQPVNWVKVPLMAFTFMIGVYLTQQLVLGRTKENGEDNAE